MNAKRKNAITPMLHAMPISVYGSNDFGSYIEEVPALNTNWSPFAQYGVQTHPVQITAKRIK